MFVVVGGYRCNSASRGEASDIAVRLRELTHGGKSEAALDAFQPMTRGALDVLGGNIESLLTNCGPVHLRTRRPVPSPWESISLGRTQLDVVASRRASVTWLFQKLGLAYRRCDELMTTANI